MATWTRETLVEAVQNAAQKHDGGLSMRQFVHATGIRNSLIYRFFPFGGWSELRKLAGLARHPQDHEPLTDEQLLQEFHRVASALGRLPTWNQFRALAGVAPESVSRRFGGRCGTHERYRDWLQQNHPGSPLLDLVPIEAQPGLAPMSTRGTIAFAGSQRAKGTGVVFGAPIHFRGLRHAPINEQGVVYLFGMVSSELGLIVEAIQSVYPDCEAKRCVDSKLNRWKRVGIEFEFKSSSFREHGHDPAGCDLIVCWEHDWPQCPLEVIPLRSVIERLNESCGAKASPVA
jgi:hypothetical protein